MKQGSFIRIPRDGFTMCPEGRYGTPLAGPLPLQVSGGFSFTYRFLNMIKSKPYRSTLAPKAGASFEQEADVKVLPDESKN